jgi:glycine/D-amino acid oxidase-like deaminating enzyme
LTDITILGAGIFGLSLAWAAARRGARVTVIDPAGPGAGASGGVVGALAPHAPEHWTQTKAFQLQALLMAGDWWAAVAAAGGRDPLFARAGRLQPIPDAAALDRAWARADAAGSLWPGTARWEIRSAADFAGWLPPGPTGRVVHDTLSARIAPRAALAALASALAAQGGRILTEGPARGAVVHATGHAGLAGPPPLGQGVKGQAALLAHDARDLPQIYAEGLHIVPHGDGTTAIGSTTEEDWLDPAATDARLDAVIARARTICPALVAAPVIARWAGIRPRATSRQPLLGPHPHHPGQFIANGGFKIGFALAPLAGEVMADLILAGHDRIPDAFRPA